MLTDLFLVRVLVFMKENEGKTASPPDSAPAARNAGRVNLATTPHHLVNEAFPSRTRALLTSVSPVALASIERTRKTEKNSAMLLSSLIQNLLDLSFTDEDISCFCLTLRDREQNAFLLLSSM